MDPVSHLLFGRTVALTVRRRPALTGVTAALVLGSILPDADAALAPRGFDLYLHAHASGTHSLVGTVVEALVLALVLSMLVTGSRMLPLLVASWVGVVGHISWDLADGSDINLFTPFSDAMLGWHLVAMGEPPVLVMLAAAVLLAWRWPVRARSFAAAALVLLSVLLTVKKMTQDRARARYAESVVQETPRALAITPSPASRSVTAGTALNTSVRFRDRRAKARRRARSIGDTTKPTASISEISWDPPVTLDI